MQTKIGHYHTNRFFTIRTAHKLIQKNYGISGTEVIWILKKSDFLHYFDKFIRNSENFEKSGFSIKCSQDVMWNIGTSNAYEKLRRNKVEIWPGIELDNSKNS